jgi:hypothetical protein
MRIELVVPVVIAILVASFLPGLRTIDGAEEGDSKSRPASTDTDAQAAERKLLREKMTARIGKVTVAPVDAPDREGQLVAEPLLSYIDEPMAVNAATLWTWALRKEGRPLALCKIVHIDRTRRAVSGEWLYCFASLSPDLVHADWPDGHKWSSSQPGVSFRDIPGAPPPATTPAARLRQIKDLGRKFTSSVEFGNSVREELRLLTQPVYSYSDDEAGVIAGGVFVAAMNGTNPTALYLIELQKEQDRQVWRFAVGAMTDGRVIVKFDGQEVWSKPGLFGPGQDFKTWTYFFEYQQGK